MSDHGYRSLGKYSTAQESILHFMCINEWATSSDGNVEAPTGYFWEVSNTPEEVSQNNGEFNSLLEEWLRQNPEVTDSEDLRAELVGHFIVIEDNRGFVSIQKFGSSVELTLRLLGLQEEFYEWDEE